MGRKSNARQQLLESATHLMQERGYTAVGVGEICRRAGVQKGSFYYFFPSKQALALAVLDLFWERIEDNLAETLGGSAAPLDKLARFCVAAYGNQRQQQREQGHCTGCFIGNLALEMSTQDPVLRDHLAEILEKQAEALAEVIAEAQRRGELPANNDPLRAARSLMAYLEGLILIAKVRNEPKLLDGAEQEALRLLGAQTAA
ncbi:MAG: TetR/AcrR family transcriptional regulator [Acidobacteriota bacterium]